MEVADAVIVIPKDFDEKVINKEKSIEIYKDDRKVESIQIQNQINKFFSFVNATYEDGKFDLDDVNTALNEKYKCRINQDGGNSKVIIML